MDLKKAVTASMKEAFDGDLADSVSTFKYYEVDNLKYAAGTAGGIVYEDCKAPLSSRGVFIYTDPTRKDLDANVLEPFDFELIVLQAEIAVTGFQIDSIIQSTLHGDLSIAKFMGDPAAITWSLYLKRLGK